MMMSDYNVTWDSPSNDSSGSMPLGNGDIGLNAWVEPNGDLLFYISKTDAWSEIARLLKVGRVRVRFTAADSQAALPLAPFRQTLDLARGLVAIQMGDIDVEVWVDANHPVIHVRAASPQPVSAEVSLEAWRTGLREIAGDELNSAYSLLGAPHPVFESGDILLATSGGEGGDCIAWCHRNPTSIWPESLALQGLAGFIPHGADPLLHRTFGGLIEGDGMAAVDERRLKSVQPQPEQRISVHVLTEQTATAEVWLDHLQAQRGRTNAVDWAQRRSAHEAWWRAFWGRSWIRPSGNAEAETVGQAYALQRFIAACAGRGAVPIKFNGSLFTVDAGGVIRPGQPPLPYDADFRMWGGPYWFQNTRLAYWPMPAAGDFDLMQPLFRMYLDALPLAQARTRLYFGHDGACFPETMEFWGAYANTNYGWDRAGKPVSHCDNTYIRHYWSGALELLALMLDAFDYTQDARFAQTALLPMASAVLAFYDQHYARDASGKLRFEPAQSLETWQDVVNPLPEIAGLQWVLDRIIALAEREAQDHPAEAARLSGEWRRLRAEVPDLPMSNEAGERALAAAEHIRAERANVENPELYAVFPYRLYGAGKPDLELGRATFARRLFRHNMGWCQDSIQAAYLGLAAEAKDMLVQRFSRRHEGSRFPAFWGPNFDWVPDQDHGSGGMITLQAMLLQADAGRILLFPAWPRDWDVEFKLRAPMSTTVAGALRRGELVDLSVEPESRRKDIVLCEPQG